MEPALIILMILFIIILGLIISIVVILVTKIKKTIKAIYYTMVNKDKCGEERCVATLENLTTPTVLDPKIYNKDVAKYLMNLNAYVTEDSIEKLPTSQILKKKLYNTDPNFPMGIIVQSGPSEVTISFRGTFTKEEWEQDFTYYQIDIGDDTKWDKKEQFDFLNGKDSPIQAKVHAGFLQTFNLMKDDILNELKILNPKTVFISGHSLGAALGIICAMQLAINGYNVIPYVFASPRVGDINFSKLVEENISLFSIKNTCDGVPNLPPSVSPNFSDYTKPYYFSDCGTAIYFTDNWLSGMNNHLGGVYQKFVNS